MASFAEIRAQTGYTVARYLIEPLIKPILLEIKPDMKNLDAVDKTGTFQDKAAGYYSVYQLSTDQEEKARALVQLSQELINLGRFRQARSFIRQAPEILKGLPKAQELLYSAHFEEKQGWIADYETGYTESLKRFTNARSYLSQISETGLNQEKEDVYSTTTHFLGRAHFGLAAQNIDRKSNIGLAVEYFKQDLERFQNLRKAGDPRPANEGFEYAWLARCALLRNDDWAFLADLHIQRAGRFFGEYTSSHPESGIKAHYYLLQGRFGLRVGDLVSAESDFQEALRIRREIERYPKGEADALSGLAAVALRKGRLLDVVKCASMAFKAYPLVLLYTIPGA